MRKAEYCTEKPLHLDTDDNHGDTVLETHLAKQNNNALLYPSKMLKKKYCHHPGADHTEDHAQNTKSDRVTRFGLPINI